MNKKVLLLGMTSILAVGTVAAVALSTNGSLISQGFKADDNYSITIEPEDIVATHQTGWQSGYALLKTDQLHNDISFAYVNANHNGEGDGLYLQGNGYGYICNEIGNEVRSMESILIKAANESFNVKWGFKNSGGDGIDWVGDEWASATPAGYEFTLNGDEPNYFKIESGQTTDPLLYQIVITYSSSCVEHANPYRVINGVKYHRSSGGEWSVMGFDGDSIENVVIEDDIDGDPVTDILAYAFYNETTIKSVSLPNTITEISQDAFRGCTSLSSVTFATGGTEDLYIYSGAFRNTALTSITLPKRLEYIESTYSLYETPSLASISIEDDYSGGNYKAVDGILYRQSIGVVELIHYPENSPYSTLNVPTDVTSIHEYSCQNTKNLKTVFFNNPNALLIDAYAFGNDNDDSSITNLYFQGAGELTLYWNPFRGYKHDMILHEDTIIRERGLGQMASGARVFFEATSVKANWHANWADSKDSALFYLYSETSPAGAAPTNIDGYWHYVGDVPTVW